MDPVTVHTLDLWFKVLKMYKIQNDAKILKWVTYDSKFYPAKYDQRFKQWVGKGIAAWCVLESKGELMSFENLRGRYDLDAHEIFRYF